MLVVGVVGLLSCGACGCHLPSTTVARQLLYSNVDLSVKLLISMAVGRAAAFGRLVVLADQTLRWLVSLYGGQRMILLQDGWRATGVVRQDIRASHT